MKQLASITALILSAFAYAENMVVPSLPDPLRPRAETETNVIFSAGAAGDNLWRLSVELDASVSNSVEVVLGIDADGDGALAVEEGELVVGWRCGRWFWRDSNDNARDITAGMVYGVNYSLDASGRKVWRKDDAAVDFPWASANPIHR